jgi:excisionase family DNA binding protein
MLVLHQPVQLLGGQPGFTRRIVGHHPPEITARHPCPLDPRPAGRRRHVASKASRDTSPNYGDRMSAQRRPPDVDDEFLTVAEVAAILKLNQQTIRNWIDQGSLAALRIGRRVRVLRRDLDQLIADAEAAPRVHEPITLEEGDEKEGWRDARQFWGGP